MIDPTQELRRLFRQAAAGAEAERALAQLLDRLLDLALEQAELRGIRLAARTVPHELVQPLSEVRGYAELLLDDAGFTEEQRHDALELIVAAAVRAGDLAHAFGRLARPDQPPPRRRRMGDEELLLLGPEPGAPAGGSENGPRPEGGYGA